MEELGFDKDFLSDSEVRRWQAMCVSILLVLFLCHSNLGLEDGVKVVEVDSELECASRSNVTLRMNREVQMVSFVGEKGRDTSGSTWGVVIGKFSKG